MSKVLDLAHKRLGWPTRQQIMEPEGSGPNVLAKSADQKIGSRIRRINGCKDVAVGVLVTNHLTNFTEAPLAIVCEFPKIATESSLLEVQKLAWNFSMSPQLITVEPHLIRSFTCCKPPTEENLSHYQIEKVSVKDVESQVAQSLHWVNLISGQYFHDNQEYFKRDQRADHMLLSNLKEVRKLLLDNKLDEDTCHDLLARVIFIQFLWDRKDSRGNAALDKERLFELYRAGILTERYDSLPEILTSKNDSYNFFRYLDEKRFNGDLFAGLEDADKQGDDKWSGEMRRVQKRHLKMIADFVAGKLIMRNGQGCLWQLYAFDIIPLEFISSIYEEFLKGDPEKEGAHYTPMHVVNYMLDGVLPWDGEEWDLKILDPACGSGIFLVKAYQRLIHRWKRCNQKDRPGVKVLRRLLTKNIFGIDINRNAVRVASFSLYLAMCEEIEPIRLWLSEDVKFPKLRDKRLVCADFFDDDKDGFRTEQDARKYDIVVGNMPWGQNVITDAAKRWAKRDPKDICPYSNKDPGPLFLPKAAYLTKETGCVSMIQPTQALLTHRRGNAPKFRKKLFQKFKVEEITNLSALRFVLFPKSVSPACIITLRPAEQTGRLVCVNVGRT
jgi:hypothetical protein